MAERVLPPTAGLPLRAADLLPWGDADLAGALAQWLGVPSVQLECSGTSALMVALQALRRLAPARSEVIVPAYTCPLVALAVAHCGLQLRLCELRPDALDMSALHLRALCSERTLAVLPTHLCGRVADVAMALDCARAVGAWVIEDAAQALGARVHGQPVGWQGDVGFYSLAVGKGLTTFEGGVLLVRDAALRDALREAHAAGVRQDAVWELRRSLELLGYAALYRPAGLGLAYGRPLRDALSRGDWVEAAGDDFDDAIPRHELGAWRRRVGRRALARLADFQQRLRRQADERRARLAAIAGVEVVCDAVPGAQGVWPVLLLRLRDAAVRDALLRAQWGQGWGLSLPFVHVLPDYGRYDHVLGLARQDAVEQARDWAQRLVAVGNSPWFGDARFGDLVDVLERQLA
ncbi:L-glutamine:2-deoxy-scyllo-inosose aminotransferase [Delftia tsuruhatensis]|uniref:DegT/DnrJ/EryC1/StrS family aminotransferase n=1 Tax=Delftia tsuruhatensis TaxID=180282 RepID=UPI001E6AD71F|nr:DegT/DnrJ/EryC1/StrS family aminotransferase [Delftia tsuruhatensis]CAB5681440.1 L-glutamine:2-deoxy-scyllo-inosose aminotransferase [Delftia tsuruhatensis]CAC9675678.1 L-glutamine:2-deoxy-scyllo-inosose aminotransferase [Delftia tsuruhatensis]